MLLSTAALGQSYIRHTMERLASSVTSQTQLESFLSAQYERPVTLQTDTVIQSLKGSHHYFDLVIDGFEVHHGLVKWNDFSPTASTLSFPVFKGEITLDPSSPSSTIAQSFIKTNKLSQYILKTDIKWFIDNNSLVKKWVIRYETPDEYKEVVIENAGEVLQENNFIVHDKADTLVYINIYNPDPLTSARTAYGATYVDDFDRNNSALEAMLETDSIRMRWNDAEKRWKLESDYAIALDIDAPFDAPPAFEKPDDSNLLLNRSQQQFEYFNAFYHINKSHEKLERLGFPNLVNYPLAFDARGSTSDQSSFVPSGIFPYLKFGIGGVDDAEDADVITHEYGHAIAFSAAPNTNLGAERAALDEGFCDYFAISYSRAISDFNRNTVFDWDGHNEFWPGRTLTNRRTYPTDLERNIYEDGILWASAVAEISDYIGNENADRIMLNSLYSWFPYMLMSDAAHLFMQSDTLLNDAANAELASIIFCDRGLLPGCEDTLISSLPLNDPYLGNSYDFAYNREPLYIYPNSRKIEAVQIFDLSGNLIYAEEWTESEQLLYEFDGAHLPQGVFILRLITDEEDFSFKLIRLWN